MLKNTLFLLEHLILQKLLASCGREALNVLMQLEVENFLQLQKFIHSFSSLFFFLSDDHILLSDIYICDTFCNNRLLNELFCILSSNHKIQSNSYSVQSGLRNNLALINLIR